MLYKKMRGIRMDESAIIKKEFKVFISYSWTTLEHETWVYDLAIRLMNDGIEAKFDKWDLEPGQDKYVFMESMVRDTTIDRVLIICDKGYKEKADSRQGGVGTETQIISSEIYNQVNQNKFIPVVAEQGNTFDAYLPTYLKNTIFIDMSSKDIYEVGYEQLLRLIAGRPKFKKPTKGQLPAFLFEDEKSYPKINNVEHSSTNKSELPDKRDDYTVSYGNSTAKAIFNGYGHFIRLCARYGSIDQWMIELVNEAIEDLKRLETKLKSKEIIRIRGILFDTKHGWAELYIELIYDYKMSPSLTEDEIEEFYNDVYYLGQSISVESYITKDDIDADDFSSNSDKYYQKLDDFFY